MNERTWKWSLYKNRIVSLWPLVTRHQYWELLWSFLCMLKILPNNLYRSTENPKFRRIFTTLNILKLMNYQFISMTVKERSCSFYNLLVNLWCFNNDNIHNFRNIFSVNLYAKKRCTEHFFYFSKGIDFNDMSGRCFCSFFFFSLLIRNFCFLHMNQPKCRQHNIQNNIQMHSFTIYEDC